MYVLGEPVGGWVEDDDVHACVCNTLIHRKAILEKLLFPLTALVCVCVTVYNIFIYALGLMTVLFLS